MADLAQPRLPQAASSLKAQGGQAFAAGNFSEALECYDAAIVEAPKAAVLHSNRAQTLLKLKRPREALEAAEKTILLGPDWSRGYQRAGQAFEALGNLPKALDRYEIASKRVAVQSEEAKTFAATIRRLNKAIGPRVERVPKELEIDEGAMPWKRFATRPVENGGQMQEGTAAARMLRACQAWELGLQALSAQQWTPSKDDPSKQVLKADAMAIQHLTNGIVADERVIQIQDPKFFEHLNHQIEFEADLFGFAASGDPASRPSSHKAEPWNPDSPRSLEALHKAVRKSVEKGWSKAKWRLMISVRVAVLKGVLAHRLLDQAAESVRQLFWAFELVAWVQSEYPEVPIDQRGSCFESSFLRAVGALLLKAFEGQFATSPSSSIYKSMNAISLAILRSAKDDPSTKNPHLRLTFDAYPCFQALVARSFVNVSSGTRSPSPQIGNAMLREGMLCYAEALKLLPSDDDLAPNTMILALSVALQVGGVRVGDLRLIAPKIRRILNHQAPNWGPFNDFNEPIDGSPSTREVVLRWAERLSCADERQNVGDDFIIPSFTSSSNKLSSFEDASSKVASLVRQMLNGTLEPAEPIPSVSATMKVILDWEPSHDLFAALDNLRVP